MHTGRPPFSNFETAGDSIPRLPSETMNKCRPPTTQVEVYLDLACSDCALAWPVMGQVAEVYSNDAEFLYRLFPLPYHRNAFTAAKVRLCEATSNTNIYRERVREDDPSPDIDICSTVVMGTLAGYLL